jgi:hypothetical protein
MDMEMDSEDSAPASEDSKVDLVGPEPEDEETGEEDAGAAAVEEIVDDLEWRLGPSALKVRIYYIYISSN